MTPTTLLAESLESIRIVDANRKLALPRELHKGSVKFVTRRVDPQQVS